MLTIGQAARPEQIDEVRGLIREFAVFGAEIADMKLEDIPAIHNLEDQLANLLGVFGPPSGCLLLASIDGVPAGCVGMWRVDADTAEIKRMYIRPAFRGRKIGDQMVTRLLAEARNMGYSRVVLDTFHLLKAAQHLYRSAGFTDVPVPPGLPEALRDKVIFMEIALN